MDRTPGGVVYTQAEVARILSVPEGTVATWISRGRAMLRRELGPDR
jgi:DNA-directed RNA polymerase specialized sigma24 family protein